MASEAKKQQNLVESKKKIHYDPSEIEPKYQAKWKREGIYHPDLDSASTSSSPGTSKPFYNLMMFPYPSAEGMHVGNMYAQTGADIYGRFKRMQGNFVFEPIGLDGFGIHAENYALKIGAHPMDHAKVTEDNFYRQMRVTGSGFDWSHTVETWKPEYYKWTQWLFVELFKAGLAYRKKAPVNFCPSCKTVLSDEQVIQKIKNQKSKIKDSEEIRDVSIGVCERCNTPVEKRNLEQWFFRITDYAERLLQNIDKLNWTDKVKIAQRNWIGKSEGARIQFSVLGSQFSEASQSVNRLTGKPKTDQLRSENRQLKTDNRTIEAFTTRPDTLHGATFMVVSPEHPLVAELLNSKLKIQNSKLKEVEDYVEKAKKKTEQERQEEGKDPSAGSGQGKTGAFSGLYAINPVNNEQIPIWIAEYVLMGYGTGAIMAVPAHDERDFEFAKKYNLPIRQVVINKRQRAVHSAVREGSGQESKELQEAYTGDGVLVNSGAWDGWQVPEDIAKVISWLEERGIGKKEVTYHLRDWLISRQRYWGPPIPMIFCENCFSQKRSWFSEQKGKVSARDWQAWGWYPAEALPVELPYIKDYRPLGSGKAPLANHPEFYETVCPACGEKARRETDVSDTFLDSSWYFLRYLATDWHDMPFPSVPLAISKEQEIIHPLRAQVEDSGQAREKEIKNWKLKIENSSLRDAWLPVTMYIGGAEHSVLHLLYSRFVTMALHDMGHLPHFEEPFSQFYAHGLLIKEGAKMSKSKGNVVVPDAYIQKFGADTLRSYLMFIGPFSDGGDFKDTGIEGMFRFLRRVWNLFAVQSVVGTKPSLSANILMHRTIRGVTEDMEQLRYNTVLAKLMTWYNYLSSKLKVKSEKLSQEEVITFLKLLAPFAPHMTEELYQKVVKVEKVKIVEKESTSSTSSTFSTFQSIHFQPWPTYDPSLLEEEIVTIAVQINGKVRETVAVAQEATQEAVEEQVRQLPNVAKYLTDTAVKKIIYRQGKIINFVI